MIEAPTLPLKTAFGLFVRIVASFLVFGLAWVFWQITSPVNWGFAVSAILGALGGGIHLIGTFCQLGEHMRKARKWKRKTRHIPQQKGDKLADNLRFDQLGMR